MAHLQKERTVAEGVTALDAFAAAYTQWLVNDIFVVGVFNKSAFDGACGAELIFSAGIESVWLRFKVAGTEFTVAAHGKFVNTFYR